MRVILGPGERGDVKVVREVTLGSSSMIDALSGDTATAVALGLTYVPFDVPDGQDTSDEPASTGVFLMAEDDAFELMCGLVAMFGGDHE